MGNDILLFSYFISCLHADMGLNYACCVVLKVTKFQSIQNATLPLKQVTELVNATPLSTWSPRQEDAPYA
jgi:hypothetical protein